MNDEKVWDSSEEEIEALLEMAKHFLRYLDSLELSDRKQFAHLLKDSNGQAPFLVDSQYLKPGSLVLPGSAIFTLFFEGTRAQYLERVT